MNNQLKTFLNVIICIALLPVINFIFSVIILLLDFEISVFVMLLASIVLSVMAFFYIRKKLLVPDKAIEIKPAGKKRSKAGHVYIASNVRALGENVFKIGMTRLENPEDRIEQLNSTSIPFEFFVHCWIPCTDALEFEGMLHSAFAVNRMDDSREFFHITLEEIQGFVQQYTDVLFTYDPVLEV